MIRRPPRSTRTEPLLPDTTRFRSGRSYEALAAEDSEAWRHFWLAPAAEVPPGGESFATLSGRVAAAIETLTRQHAGSDIVCIGHGGTTRAALATALSGPPEQALSFALDNCSERKSGVTGKGVT